LCRAKAALDVEGARDYPCGKNGKEKDATFCSVTSVLEPPAEPKVTILHQQKARCFADLFTDRGLLFRGLCWFKVLPFDS